MLGHFDIKVKLSIYLNFSILIPCIIDSLFMVRSGHGSLVSVPGENLVDLVWKTLGDPSQPPRPCNPITTVPLSFAGKSWEAKFDEVRLQMTTQGVSSVILFALDEIAWILNLRGSDIEKNPVFFAFLVLTHSEAHLFVDGQRGPDSVDLMDYLKSTSHPVRCIYTIYTTYSYSISRFR